MTTQRYHKIAEEPKTNYDLSKPERHRYSELEVIDEFIRDGLFSIMNDPQRNSYLKRDKAYVALKILYRIEEHHKMARNGRPDYPKFSWEMVKHFAGTAPFTYTEYSTPKTGGGKRPGQDARSNSPTILAPAHPQEDTA